MKKLTYVFAVLVITLTLSGITLNAQTLVSDWGSTPRGSNGWTILNTATTPAGNAAMGGSAKPTGWMSIKGGFNAITATTSQAFVITGTFEFVGGGANNAYTWLRFALFNGDGALTGKNSPTAAWSETSNGNGYIFTPVTGVGEISNTYNTWPQGNRGTNWPLINSKSWTSTNSNGGGPFTTIMQAPSRQVASAGVYDWAISVQPLANGTNEVRWYFAQQHAATSQNYYWWGGSFIDDRVKIATFNSIGFACNNDLDATTKQVNLTNVKVTLGSPITVPEAPWQAYYVDAFGNTPRGTAWPILNDSTYVVGNSSMGADKKPSGWASIKGGFREAHTPTLKKALIVSGTFEYVGGGANNAYTWLRYALTYQDSAVLKDKNKKTANWTGKTHSGYEFTPRTGVGEMANGGGGSGTVWTVPNVAGWNSTYSGNVPLISVVQAPSRAIATAGVYDWAISVQPLADGTNEIRWYFVKKAAAGKQSDYWFGGTVIDKNSVSKKFNGIMFSVNNDVDETCKQVNINDVKVDMGNPITVPEAPWQAYYVDTWGNTPRGTAWPILNTADYVVGNASMGADKKPSGWASIKGGFKEAHTPTTKKALIVSGTFEYVGGGANNAYTWLRYALTYQDSAVLKDQNKTTANWTGKTHSGYEFTPRTGVGELANGGGGSGVVWTVPNVAGWNSTYSGNVPLITVDQLPSRAVATAGVYDWAISVQPLADGTNEIRWYFIKKAAAGKPTDYWFGGTVIEKNPVSTKFNGIMFSVNNDVDETCKQVNINDVKVDMGNPLTIPEAPWQAFYVDAWGVLGQRRGNAGWVMTPGDVIGDVTMSGKVAPTDFAVIRGQFGTLVTPTTAKALIVTGNIEFVGGGFDNWGFRYGLFNSDAGKVETAAYYNWLGAETKHSGYLFFPQSGGKYPWDWPGGKAGTFGGIFNEVPVYNYSAQDYPVGTAIPIPTNVIAKAGRYDFAISVQPLADGTAEIRHFLTSRDKKYFWADKAIDKNTTRAATKFNSIVFALGQNASTTAMKIHDVKVDIGNAITLPTPTAVEDVVSSIPTEYSLNQNYPNPFNPTTTIEYALPKSGAVKLVVYDVLGREVAELVNKDLDAGYHKVDFNAASISSGVYFYSIKAGDFASVKKLILLK